MTYKRKRLVVILIAAMLMIGILLALAVIAQGSAAQTTAAQADVIPAQGGDGMPVLSILSCVVIAGCSAVVIVLLSVSIIKGGRKT